LKTPTPTTQRPTPCRKKGKRRLHQPKGTLHQQYDVGRRIWTDISNAMYDAAARVAEWIKERGEKQDKRIWAAVDGIKGLHRRGEKTSKRIGDGSTNGHPDV